MQIGLQMYSIRLLCEQNYEKALEVAANAGYKGVEFAGFFDVSKEEMKNLLDKYGLVAAGSHTGYDLLANDLDNVIEYNKAIGNTRIICPGAHMQNREDVLGVAKLFKEISPKLKENGMQLFYHNHDFEFVKDGGEYLMDILANETTPDELRFEIDAYWVYKAGLCPIEYIKKHSDRVGIFHAKDGNKQEGTVAGAGEVDLVGVVNLGKELGIEWAVVEAEAGTTIDEQCSDVIESAKYLKTIV